MSALCSASQTMPWHGARRTVLRAAPRTALGALLALALGLLAPQPAAQDGEVDADTAALPAVEAPPELDARDLTKLQRAVKKLRNSNVERRRSAEDEVISFGRGALPELLDAAGTTHEGMIAGIQRCLVTLVDLRDRELVADALQSEKITLRRFAVEAAGRLHHAPLLERLPHALTDPDADVRALAALALAANGREEGLAALVDAWVSGRAEEGGHDRWSAPILAALEGLRDTGPHQPLLDRLVVDPRDEREDPKGAAEIRLATVALLHHLGDEAAVRGLAKALEDNHNLVQRAAIDAVRELVEHKPPFEGATFQQIKELERLRTLLHGWRGFPRHADDDG